MKCLSAMVISIHSLVHMPIKYLIAQKVIVVKVNSNGKSLDILISVDCAEERTVLKFAAQKSIQ